MKRVLTAVVLIPLVLLVVLKAPLWVFVAVCGLVALLAADEYLSLARLHQPEVPRLPGLFLVIIWFALIVILPNSPETTGFETVLWVVMVPVIYPFLLLALGLKLPDTKAALNSAALGAFLVPYVLLPFFSLVGIRFFLSNSWFYLLWLFAMVWSGDIFAYYVGKNFGKHLLAPRVSPKKTWEGTIASVVGSAAVSTPLVWFAPQLQAWMTTYDLVHATGPTFTAPLWTHLLAAASIAIVINLMAQIGDLAESVIKRGAGVKDSGSLLPGHGGILDRIDALLFAAPAALLLFLMIDRWLPPVARRIIVD